MRGIVSTAFAILGLVAFGAGAESATPVFQPLGSLGGGSYWISEAHGISPDGRVVVGRTRSPDGFIEAAYWTRQTGWVLIGDLPGGDIQGIATACSTDGSIIVGSGESANGREAFLWTAEAGIQGLGDLPGGSFYSQALGVSADGRVVVGQGDSGTPEAFRWQAETGMEGLGFLPGGERHSVAYDVSADGSTIVGHSRVPFREGGAFRWTAEEGMQDLGNPPPAQLQMYGRAISADGVTIAGHTASGTLPAFAFRWDLAHGYEIFNALGSLYLACFRVSATNGDGTVIVGSSSTQTHNEEAFVWDHLRGIRSLRDTLEVDYGIDLTGWRFYLATDVSDDGLVIAGAGFNPEGLREGWVVTFPIEIGIDIKPRSPLNLLDPASHGFIRVAVLGSETLDVSEMDETTLAFGPEAATPAHHWGDCLRDVNEDGFTDLVTRYRIDETGIAYGDTEACLTGETFEGRPFEGCDSIITVGACGKGFELALIWPALLWTRRLRRRV